MSDLLEIAARVLEAVKPPQGTFDANGAWRHTYGLYDLGANLAARINVVRTPVGTLTLTRKPASGGGAVLEVDLRRRTPPGSAERIPGRMTCGAGVLATPSEWEFAWQSNAGQQGQSLQRKSSQKPKPPDPYTSNWALFDVVQRLPRTPAAALRFTMLDEFDLAKPNQSLTFRKTTQVALSGGPVKLHAFEQFGSGVLPVMYWTDEQGRLLFVISGLIGYAMEGAAQ